MLYIAGAALADVSTADEFDIGVRRFNALKVSRTAPAEACLLWAVELQEVGPVPVPAPSSGGTSGVQEAGNG